MEIDTTTAVFSQHASSPLDLGNGLSKLVEAQIAEPVGGMKKSANKKG